MDAANESSLGCTGKRTDEGDDRYQGRNKGRREVGQSWPTVSRVGPKKVVGRGGTPVRQMRDKAASITP